MNDDRVEKAFRDGLHQHADGPDFRPLQVNETPTKRRSWPRWFPAAAAVAVLAAFAIPAMLNRGSDGVGAAIPARATASAADRSSTGALPAPKQGWRWESYRVLTYQVPTSWGYGMAPGTSWCSGRPSSPAVGAFVDTASELRAVRAILCPRNIPVDRLRMFVSVRAVNATDRGWDLPSGWTVSATVLDGYRLEVVHPAKEQAVAQRIVASVRPLPALDFNGCPSTSPFNGSTPPSAASAFSGLARASLCQYDLETAPALVASTSLPAIPAAQLRTILTNAATGSGPDDTSCTSAGDTAVLVRLWSADDRSQDVFVRYSGCVGNGVDDGTTARELTAEVCQAIMTPPLRFTSGHGAAAKLCAPAPNPTPSLRPPRPATPPGGSPSPTR